MVTVAKAIPGLANLANLREAADAWYRGKDDPRMEAFGELMTIAKESGTNLHNALLIKRGRDADLNVAQARQDGRKDAYSHKPNPSLSGSQGGKGEGNYQPLTDSQIDAMAEDHTLHPSDWYDKNGDLVKAKIPKKAWRIFDFA